jgi:DNA-binding CsgD family transcriptional regulator/tetratricopeptide (TPR) repeat protein
VSSPAPELLAAGRAALGEARWEAARSAFAAAVDVEVSGDALLGLSESLWWLGDLHGAVTHRERAFERFRDAGDMMQAALAALYTSLDYRKQYGDTATAAGWLAQAARIVDGNGLEELRGWLLFLSSFNSDDAVEAERLARDAEHAAAGLGDRELELCALSQVGASLVAQGRVAEGVRCLDESMAVALGTGSPDAVVFTSCTMMTSCTRCAEFGRAVQWVRRTIEFTQRYGNPFLHAECRLHYGGVLLATGDWPLAERELLAGLEMARGAVPSLRRLAVSNLAALRLAQGRFEDAERLVDGDDHPELAGVQARLHLWRGEPAAAVGVLRRRLETVGGDRLEASAVAELLGEAELVSGDIAGLAGRAAALIAEGGDRDCGLISARGHRLAGRAASLAGDVAAARRSLDAALVGFTRLELTWEALRTRVLLAGALEEAEPEVAAAEAKAALTAAERIGAIPLADEAAGLLRRLGVAAARGTPGDGAALSRREQQVLALLGEGLSNPEIAARLHLSRRTVEHHVAHVLTKLGVRNRAEAAAEAVRRAAISSATS